jgi:hypothetical protein
MKYAVIVICIYRSPDGKLGTFLNKLELIIQKLMMKFKTLILCGDWNINFFQTSSHTKELNNLLLRYNLKHIVNVPTRITKITATLLDVLITNEKKSINSLKVMDLGQSDHYAQILSISVSNSSNIPNRSKKNEILVKLMFKNSFIY